MPISFAQPEPFDATGSQTRLRQENIDRQLRQEAQLRALSIGQQQAEASQRFALGMGGLSSAVSDRAERSRQFDVGLQAQAQRDQYLAQQELVRQEQRAGLDAWESQQAITHAENVRLQRMQAGLGAIKAKWGPGGSEEDLDAYYDALLEYQTGISPIEQKLKRSQAEAAQALARQRVQEASHEAAAQKAFEQTMARGRVPTQFVIPKAALIEFDKRVPPVDPSILVREGPEAFKRAQMERRAEVEQMAFDEGYGTMIYMHEAGKWKDVKASPPAKAEKPAKPFDPAKAASDAAAEARNRFPDDKLSEQGRPQVSQEQLDRRNKYAAELFARSAREGRPGEPGTAFTPGSVAPPSQRPDVAAGQQVPALAPDRPAAPVGPPEKSEPYKVGADPKTLTPPQQAVLQHSQNIRDRLPSVPTGSRTKVAVILERMEELAAKWGLPTQIADPKEKAEYKELQIRLTQLLPQNLPAGAAPDRRSSSPPQSRVALPGRLQ